MATWQEFTDDAPELAERVTTLFRAHRHHVMATVRADGAPRLSGTEVELGGPRMRLGMMAGSRRAADLRRDPRVAIHCHSVDPPEEDHSAWSGEAKLSGRAVEVDSGTEEADAFEIELDEVVLTRVGTPADHLVIERWTPSGGIQRIRR